MAKEYLVVKYRRRRRLMINDQFMGYTNKNLELEGGKYTVTLGPPDNYKPPQINIDLQGTAAMLPMIIEFEEI